MELVVKQWRRERRDEHVTEALTRPDPVGAMPRRPKKGDDDCATNFTGQPVDRRLVWVSDIPLLVSPSVSRILLIKTRRVCLTIGPLAVSKLFLICFLQAVGRSAR
jgi:hypothetical protein